MHRNTKFCSNSNSVHSVCKILIKYISRTRVHGVVVMFAGLSTGDVRKVYTYSLCVVLCPTV